MVFYKRKLTKRRSTKPQHRRDFPSQRGTTNREMDASQVGSLQGPLFRFDKHTWTTEWVRINEWSVELFPAFNLIICSFCEKHRIDQEHICENLVLRIT